MQSELSSCVVTLGQSEGPVFVYHVLFPPAAVTMAKDKLGLCLAFKGTETYCLAVFPKGISLEIILVGINTSLNGIACVCVHQDSVHLTH